MKEEIVDDNANTIERDLGLSASSPRTFVEAESSLHSKPILARAIFESFRRLIVFAEMSLRNEDNIRTKKIFMHPKAQKSG